EAAGTGEKVKIGINWWGGDSRHEATMNAINAFMEENPDIEVEMQYAAWGGWTEKMGIMLSGNTEPDVMQINWNWIYMFSKDGNGFYDLNQLSDIIDIDQFPDNLIEQMTMDGKLQGIPISSTGKLFLWNKTTFEKAGLDVPASFEDMINAGQVFQEKLGDDYYPMALTCYEQMLLMIYYLQQKYDKPWIADQQVNFTQEEVADGIAWIRMLEDSHVFPSQAKLAGDGAETMDLNQNWVNGKYAGFLEWDSSQQKFANALAEGQEMVVGEFPYDYGDTPVDTVKISMAWAISKNTKHPEEAARLVEYLLNDENGVKILGLERGVVASAKAQKILEDEGLLSGLTYEGNKAAMANTSFALDPYFEDSTLKDSTGLYFEIFEDLSYDNTDPMELAERLIEGINAVQDENK
ncbi:MAG: carbohydrate ABC transporter substrate-binding protein, partial [Lachnospiraceae bacterium]|nr:carbohydrate ABC transporter substrate-binding protein [Lachnospiraceae bacterium]